MQRPRPSLNKEPSTTVEALVQRMDARGDGTAATDTVPTGFPSLDRMLAGGFRRQDLIVLQQSRRMSPRCWLFVLLDP